MKLISHRGNVKGPSVENENRPDYVIEAWQQGYDVEVDVWLKSNKFFLGHDNPQYEVDEIFLGHPSLWCHAKNIDALYAMINLGIHCFWHQSDDVALTSRGWLWTYPGKQLTKSSICLMPGPESDMDFSNCGGICSDWIHNYRNLK
tara:strand:- start:108 stop:545 length:438 start_codon:yes stop_codon:yes gene_type:complete